MIVDVCHCIAGIGDDGVRQLSQWTLENEHKELLQNIGGLKFMENGIKVDHKPFSVRDFLIQFHRMFNLLFIQGIREFLVTFIGYSLIFIICTTMLDKKILEANTCKPINVTSNGTCGQGRYDHDNSNIYIITQACVLFFLGVPLTCLGAIMFGPLLHVFSTEHRNRKY